MIGRISPRSNLKLTNMTKFPFSVRHLKKPLKLNCDSTQISKQKKSIGLDYSKPIIFLNYRFVLSSTARRSWKVQWGNNALLSSASSHLRCKTINICLDSDKNTGSSSDPRALEWWGKCFGVKGYGNNTTPQSHHSHSTDTTTTLKHSNVRTLYPTHATTTLYTLHQIKN